MKPTITTTEISQAIIKSKKKLIKEYELFPQERNVIKYCFTEILLVLRLRARGRKK